MKKSLRIAVLCACAWISAISNGKAQGTLIHYWHFNNFTHTYNLPDIPGIAADFSIHDTSTAKILYAKLPGVVLDSAYIDPYAAVAGAPDFDTVNTRMGAADTSALRTRNPSDSMQLLFYIPTTHYKNILLQYATERSNNGMLRQSFDYSVDSGLTWRTSGLTQSFDSPAVAFHRVAVSFGSDTQVNNNAKLVFRIKFSGNTVGTSGNNRFDNVTVEGDSITASGGSTPPAAVASVSTPGYNLYPNPVSNELFISSALTGNNSYQIINMTGAPVMNGTASGNFSVNTSALPGGNYFIIIRNEATGRASSMRFTKQ